MEAFDAVVETVRESLKSTGAPPEILIGLSGGADSVALLHALCALRKDMKLRLSAVYVNHGLRSSAETEEVFCGSLCKRLDVSFYVKRVRVRREGSLEAAAREARYAAFYAALEETRCKTLALAHHMDDQAETVLLHLLYGTGGDGLSGMLPYRAPVWRPLLEQPRAALREALTALGQPWCEDESNTDEAFTRNYIRCRVMPPICGAFPKAVPTLCRTAGILREEGEYLRQNAQKWLLRHGAHGRWPFLAAEELKKQHPALQRHIVRVYAAALGIRLDFAQTEALRQLASGKTGDAVNLPGGWRAWRGWKHIHLLSPEKLPPMKWQADALRADSAVPGGVGDGKQRQVISRALYEQAVLRTKRPGDWIRPFGMQGRMKLKDYLISRRVDQPFRRDWPLLCTGDEVLWVIGVGVSESLRRAPGDENTLMLCFQGDLPDKI